MNKLKNKIFFIIGPTASGKTWSSIELAKKVNGEILNTDAFSFYKNCDIMTAKATQEEQKVIKHHMISFLNIDDINYSVRNFKKDATLEIQKIVDNQKSVVIVGGSNYFQQSLIFENQEKKIFQVTNDIKQNIQKYLQKEDFEKVYNELLKTDIQLFFHKNDFRKTQNLAKQILDDKQCEDYINLDFQKPKFDNAKFLILRNIDKDFALELIKKRIQDMIFHDDGLSEIWNTLKHYNKFESTYKGVFQGIGYKEFLEVYQKYPDLQHKRQEIINSKEFQNCLNLLELRTFQLYKDQLKWIKKQILKYPVVKTNCVILDFNKEMYEQKGKQIFSESIEKLINLETQQIQKQEIHKNDNKLYQCEYCQKIVNGIITYEKHINSQKHKKKIQKLKNTKTKKTYQKIKTFKCNVCNKILKGGNHYKQHINSKKHLNMLQKQNQINLDSYFYCQNLRIQCCFLQLWYILYCSCFFPALFFNRLQNQNNLPNADFYYICWNYLIFYYLFLQQTFQKTSLFFFDHMVTNNCNHNQQQR